MHSQIQGATNQAIELTEKNCLEANTDKTKDLVIHTSGTQLIALHIVMNGCEIK